MRQPIRFVGLDVHADSITVAVADEGQGEARHLGRFPSDLTRLLRALDRLGERGSLRCAYEAGPTGFGLQRSLAKAGIDCVVIAPSKTPRGSGERVKTDRRDAARLAHFLRSGDLVKIRVPDEACEAMRDLLRAREAAKRAQLRARHQLSKFLLRHGRRFERGHWSNLHLEWIARQEFDHAALDAVLAESLQAVREETERIERFDRLLAELVPKTEHAELIKALQAFRGIQLLTAASVAFELGDLRRFPTARKLMGYLGTTPSEDSTGERVRRGAITKAGNSGLRRLLVESAWSYRHRPCVSPLLRRRAEGVAPGVQAIAWKAQVRLNARYKKMLARGKTKQKMLVAVARELAGFIWAVGQEEQLTLA